MCIFWLFLKNTDRGNPFENCNFCWIFKNSPTSNPIENVTFLKLTFFKCTIGHISQWNNFFHCNVWKKRKILFFFVFKNTPTCNKFIIFFIHFFQNPPAFHNHRENPYFKTYPFPIGTPFFKKLEKNYNIVLAKKKTNHLFFLNLYLRFRIFDSWTHGRLT